MKRRLQGPLFRGLALGLLAVAALVAARGLERHNTWYLASDQFAFLTFGADLRAGRVFHEAGFYEQLVAPARRGQTLDALFQTYYLHGEKLFSRYPPGFPAMLAVAGALGGELGQHLLNPVLYLLLLLLVAWVAAAGLRPLDRRMAAGAAVCAAWLMLLLPTDIHLWGITVVRDLPTHLLALAAILAALRRRHAWCGAALGLACTIRPDAVLYGISVGAVFLVARVRLRHQLVAAVAFLVAALPLFAYNTATLGHPFAFTQGGEFHGALSALPRPPQAFFAQAVSLPSGGAFRLRNLASSLPGNLRSLAASFGWFAVLTAIGAAWSVRVRPIVAAAFLPYSIAALLFYSFWSHPDPRYLAGVSLGLIVLTATGVAATGRMLAGSAAEHPRWVVAAMASAVGVALFAWRGIAGGAGFTPNGPAIAVAGALIAIGAVAWLRRPAVHDRFAALAPGVALAALAVVRLLLVSGPRDPFQRAQVERARGAIEAMVPAGALVITSESLGRPAENIAHYTHADALYASELRLLGRDSAAAVAEMALVGRSVFFLLDADDQETLRTTRSLAQTRVVARRHGFELYDWFVDPRRAPRGAALYAADLTPQSSELLREVERRRRGGATAAP